MDDLQTGRVLQKLENLEANVKEINEKLDQHYVTSDQFEPVRKIVYAMVALILIGFVGALIALVYRGGNSLNSGAHAPDQVSQREGNRQ